MADASRIGGKVVYLTEVPPERSGGLFEGEPDVMDVKRAARLLDCDPKTVRRLIDRGLLERIKVGTRVRITKMALIDFVSRGGSERL